MAHTCPVCSAGHLHTTGIPYMQMANETLIQAPTIMGWKCDICGETFFDGRAVRQLELLINEAGPPPNRFSAPNAPAEREAVEPTPEPDSAKGLRPPTE
jgi:hypothetical protein